VPDDPQRCGNYTYISVPCVYYNNFNEEGEYIHAPEYCRENAAIYLINYGPAAVVGEDVTFDGIPDNATWLWLEPPPGGVPPRMIPKPWPLVLTDLGCSVGELSESELDSIKYWNADLATLSVNGD